MLILDPNRTALVIIDMQNDFCHPDGYYAGLRPIERVQVAVEPVVRLTAQAREAGAGIVFTRLVHAPETGPMEARHRLLPALWSATGEDRLIPGTWGAEMLAELAPQFGDTVIDKTNYSAFVGTRLTDLLRAQGWDTLLLCGVTTYACVLATAFSAFDNGFDVVLAKDATASWDIELTEAAGKIVERLLGRAIAQDDICFRAD